jgi:hypothetical protein
MKNVPKDSFAKFQERMFSRLDDSAEDEAEAILRIERVRPPTEENHEKLRTTGIAGATFLNNYGKKK